MKCSTLAMTMTLAMLLAGTSATQTQTPAPSAPSVTQTNLGNDANGNALRRALKTGHMSNYDESKVAPYSLPDPLVLANGKAVRNADSWTKQRRPQLIKLYEN